MVRNRKNPYDAMRDTPCSKTGGSKQCKKLFFLLILIAFVTGGLSAQTEFPEGDFWSLDGGFGISGTKANGTSIQFIIDPKLWISPLLMVGSKLNINYGLEKDPGYSDTLTLQGQVYLRWNFLRLGNPRNTTNIFLQGGLGLQASYRGDDNPFDNVRLTRGSALAEAALGVTIPLGERWHIEPQVFGGYPHEWGASITAGYKFPLRTKYVDRTRTDYREIIRTIPPTEIVKLLRINAVEFILFGPDIGRYNLGVDRDGQALNDLVLDQTARFLRANPDYHVRLEGHANPVTNDPREADELMALSTVRANTVAQQLRARGVSEGQIVIVAFGGTRTVTNEQDRWNRNRRVELIVLQVDTGADE